MQLGGLTRGFLQRFGGWDRASQIAFALGIVVLIAVLAVGTTLPPEQRWYTLVGVVGVVVVMQVIFMYANRGMVTAYTTAQRHYLDGDFETARTLLEGAVEKKPNDYKALTLLGNVYRQLGNLDKSEEVLTTARQIAPNHHFVLYGFGRTLLVKGQYVEAVQLFTQALEQGAPPTVQADLAEALYRADAPRQDTVNALHQAAPNVTQEAHRELLVAYLLHRLGEAQPPEADLVKAGIAFWEASAERFRHTPYGTALMQEVEYLRTLEE